MMIEISKRQQSDDDYKQILAEKKGMIEFIVDTCNQQYELATPITFNELNVVQDMPLDHQRVNQRKVWWNVTKWKRQQEQASQMKRVETIEVVETKTGLTVTYDLTEDDAKDLTDFLEMRGYNTKRYRWIVDIQRPRVYRNQLQKPIEFGKLKGKYDISPSMEMGKSNRNIWCVALVGTLILQKQKKYWQRLLAKTMLYVKVNSSKMVTEWSKTIPGYGGGFLNHKR